MGHLRRSWESEFGFQSLQSVPLFDLGKGGNSDFPRRGLVSSAKLTKCVICSVSLSLVCTAQRQRRGVGGTPVNDQHSPRAPSLVQKLAASGRDSARGPTSPGPLCFGGGGGERGGAPGYLLFLVLQVLSSCSLPL